MLYELKKIAKTFLSIEVNSFLCRRHKEVDKTVIYIIIICKVIDPHEELSLVKVSIEKCNDISGFVRKP